MDKVAAVIIKDLKMIVESESYIDAMHAILTYQGWINCSKPMLAGMTAAAFRFTVNRRLTAESSTAYNWAAENFLAADFIGVTAGQYSGFRFDWTFPLYQQHAVSEVKRSIDRDIGAVLWQDKFVIAVGYDDKQEVLWISDGTQDDPKQLPYIEFGCNISPYWYFQVFEAHIALDQFEIYKESLMQAVNKWETHDPMLLESEYACGRSAYDGLIAALHSGEYDREGLKQICRCYSAAKRDIRLYISALELYWPALRPAVEHYAHLAGEFDEAVRLAAELGAEARLIERFVAAQQLEERAIQSLKSFMHETIDIRTNDIALR